MTKINFYDAISATVGNIGMKDELVNAFDPILDNSQLISSFTNLSEHSPIFQKSLTSLKEAVNTESSAEVIEGCRNFYSNVFTLSEELSLILENSFKGLGELNIPGEGTDVDSKSFLGSILFLLMTSNDDTCMGVLNTLNS